MGRMALIIVMGLTLTLGIVGFSLNKAKSGTIENVSGFDKYTNARNIAHTAVNVALRQFLAEHGEPPAPSKSGG